MEMMRQLAYLHDHMWNKKTATTTFPVIIEEYQCRHWVKVESMEEELGRYGFSKIDGVDHYDPDHRIHTFYMRERKKNTATGLLERRIHLGM